MIPLMPKGVEHNNLLLLGGAGLLVMIPLMPKGVEHISASVEPTGIEAGDDSIDAERRWARKHKIIQSGQLN